MRLSQEIKVTATISILDALGEFGLEVNIFNCLPLYSRGLGWIIPAAVGALAGFIYGRLRDKGLKINH